VDGRTFAEITAERLTREQTDKGVAPASQHSKSSR
jgi:hypothetical protein